MDKSTIFKKLNSIKNSKSKMKIFRKSLFIKDFIKIIKFYWKWDKDWEFLWKIWSIWKLKLIRIKIIIPK